MWCKLCGVSYAVQAVWCKLCGLRHVVSAALRNTRRATTTVTYRVNAMRRIHCGAGSAVQTAWCLLMRCMQHGASYAL